MGVEPSSPSTPGSSPAGLLKRLSRPLLDREVRWALGFVRPYAKGLVLVLVVSLAGTALSLYIPYLSKDLVDTALLGQDSAALTRIVAMFAGITVVSFGLNVVAGLRYTRTSADILFDMRLALYRHLQRLSPRFYARTPVGDIMSRINNDIGEIQRIVSESLLAWLMNIAYLLGTVVILTRLDARLFLVSLIMLPPCLWALVRYRRRLESITGELRERSAEIGSFLIETILGLKLTVASNAQPREQRRFRRKNDAFIRALMSMRMLTYLAGGAARAHPGGRDGDRVSVRRSEGDLGGDHDGDVRRLHGLSDAVARPHPGVDGTVREPRDRAGSRSGACM